MALVPWILNGFTFPAGEEPHLESTMPEEQEDEHIEDTPIGANDTDATISTYVNTPSIGADGSSPLLLRGSCSLASKASIFALKRTTGLLKTPFDTTGKSVYVKRIRFTRWTSSFPGVVGSTQEFQYWISLLGR